MQPNNNNNTTTTVLVMANDSSLMVAADIKNTKPTLDHHQNICKNPYKRRLVQSYCKDFQYYDQTLMMSRPSIGGQEEIMSIPSAAEESGREKLFRHWNDVGGSVCIPEKWDQEGLLKDWTDCSLFDAFLVPKGVVSAREALAAERKRDRKSSTKLIKMERMY